MILNFRKTGQNKELGFEFCQKQLTIILNS